MKPTFANADHLETLEQYGAALVVSMISLQTLEAFHISAYKAGLLDTDEAELSKTMCWELRRLMALYKQQVENINARVPDLDTAKIMEGLKAMAPGLPKKRKGKKE